MKFMITAVFSSIYVWRFKKKTKQKKVECIRKLDNCYVEVITDSKLDSYQLRFAYFEKNCRKKCMHATIPKVSWVVLS